MFGDSNGQIKLHAKQKFKFLSATNSSERSSSNTYVKKTVKEQNNTDYRQQNRKCRLCGDRDETINHIISDGSNLTLKDYKTRHGWFGKVIHWKLCKKMKYDRTNKWYMYKEESILENEIYRILWEIEI